MSYVSEVADLVSRCRSATILNPSEYALIAEWEKQEIPIVVILDSVKTIFDVAENGSRKNIALDEIFHNEVKRNFADWLQNKNKRK